MTKDGAPSPMGRNFRCFSRLLAYICSLGEAIRHCLADTGFARASKYFKKKNPSKHRSDRFGKSGGRRGGRRETLPKQVPHFHQFLQPCRTYLNKKKEVMSETSTVENDNFRSSSEKRTVRVLSTPTIDHAIESYSPCQFSP